MTSSITLGDAHSSFQAGTIHGPVHTTFHLPPGKLRESEGTRVRASANNNPASVQPETPPHPSIVIPFARDADFVERGELFDQIQQRCVAPGSRTALVGLGGVG
jgi:hypothetical protein